MRYIDPLPMAAVFNMSSSREVLQLYRQMLRMGSAFTSYNFRCVVLLMLSYQKEDFARYFANSVFYL